MPWSSEAAISAALGAASAVGLGLWATLSRGTGSSPFGDYAEGGDYDDGDEGGDYNADGDEDDEEGGDYNADGDEDDEESKGWDFGGLVPLPSGGGNGGNGGNGGQNGGNGGQNGGNGGQNGQQDEEPEDQEPGVLLCTAATSAGDGEAAALSAAMPAAIAAVKAADDGEVWLVGPSEEWYFKPPDVSRPAWLANVSVQEAFRAIGHPLMLGEEQECITGQTVLDGAIEAGYAQALQEFGG